MPMTPLDEDIDSSNSDKDDTEALLAELDKIKKERILDQTKKENEQRQEEERIQMENTPSGNSLLTRYSAVSSKTELKVNRVGMMMWYSKTVQNLNQRKG